MSMFNGLKIWKSTLKVTYACLNFTFMSLSLKGPHWSIMYNILAKYNNNNNKRNNSNISFTTRSLTFVSKVNNLNSLPVLDNVCPWMPICLFTHNRDTQYTNSFFFIVRAIAWTTFLSQPNLFYIFLLLFFFFTL